MWVIEKVINNNVVNAQDEQGAEAMLTGKGIGFQKKKGDRVDEEKIERVFLPDEKKKSYKLEEMFKDIPEEYMFILTECIEYAKKTLKKELNSNLYITLMEHLTLVVERVKQGMVFANPMLLELKHFYPQEFEVAEYTRNYINQVLQLDLPEDETGFLTMHFLNAEHTSNIPEIVLSTTKFLQDILQIIEHELGISFDTSTYEYGRFLTHLKYLAQQVLEGIQEEEEEDDEFYISVQRKHKEAYACVQKIEQYVKEQYHMTLSEEEKMYLTVYIKRNLMKYQKK